MTNSLRAEFARETNVSRETIERLDIYADLLRRWTQKINLVSKGSLDLLWTRHFLDSAQLLTYAPRTARVWADLGSGGGFPGAVVAILAADVWPSLKVTLVEADQRKAVFLRTVLREVGVEGNILAQRIEDVPPLSAHVLSARALAPLSELFSLSEKHLAPDGRALFLKGEKSAQEVAAALESWRFDCETFSSKTDLEAVILSIGDIQRV